MSAASRRRIIRIVSALIVVSCWSSFSRAATSAEGSAKSARQVDNGTTVVGDQDAAVGLYLTPWKNEAAADIDRAPGLLDRETASADSNAFARKIANDDALAAYRRARLENR